MLLPNSVAEASPKSGLTVANPRTSKRSFFVVGSTLSSGSGIVAASVYPPCRRVVRTEMPGSATIGPPVAR